MMGLVAATAAFLIAHFVTSTPLRAKLVGAIGEWPYRGLYSLVAFITLGWMIWAYAGAPREPLWSGIREIPRILMPVAFVLLACGFWRNPTLVGADKLLKSEDPARGIIRITRHPIMWAFMLWAAAHIIARGDLSLETLRHAGLIDTDKMVPIGQRLPQTGLRPDNVTFRSGRETFERRHIAESDLAIFLPTHLRANGT